MRFKKINTAIKACLLVSLAALSGLVSAMETPSHGVDNSQPNNNTAMAAGVITTSGLDAANIIGSTVGGVVSGGGAFAGGVKRFALGQGKTGQAAAAGGSLWNGWIAYSHSKVDYEYAPLRSGGSVDLFLGGVDYQFNSNMVGGIAIAFDDTDVDLHFSGGKLTGDGFTVSPYLGIVLSPQWALDATLGFGRSDIDTQSLGVSGSTSADRIMASLGATFRHKMDNWSFLGRGALLTVKDEFDGYQLSNGVNVRDANVRITQLRLSGQVGYDFGYVTPYAGLSYIYDISRPDQVNLGVVPSNDSDSWTPTIGLRFKTDGAVYGSIQWSTERSRDDIKNDQFLLNIGIRF